MSRQTLVENISCKSRQCAENKEGKRRRGKRKRKRKKRDGGRGTVKKEVGGVRGKGT